MRRGLGRARGSGGVTTMAKQPILPGTKAIPVARRIRWDRNPQTLSVSTTWWAMSGNGRKTVMLKLMPTPQRMAAQVKQQRTASASTGAVAGCTLPGSSDQPPAKGTQLTIATELWDFASLKLFRPTRKLRSDHRLRALSI